MRHFQVLMVALLTAITFELGLMIVKLPTPAVQAQVPRNIPTPTTMEDPHEILKRQIVEVQRGLADVQRGLGSEGQRLTAIEQQLTAVGQQLTGVAQSANDADKNAKGACLYAVQLFRRTFPGREPVAAYPCT